MEEFTIVGTFSRPRMVKPWLISLYKFKLPRFLSYDKIKLLIYDNTDTNNVMLEFKTELPYLRRIYKDVFYHQSYRKPIKNLRGMPQQEFNKTKLKNIFEMWQDLTKLIDTDLFMLVEDDTLAPPHALNYLLNDFLSLPRAGLVTAIETGRATFPWQQVRLGVHKLVRRKNKILKRISLDPNLKGIQEVDCCGVYCFITKLKLYKKAIKQMKSYVKKLPYFGMDNILTNNIKRMGYKIYADFRVWCDHVQQNGKELVKFNKKQAVQMMDIWIKEANNYAQGVIIKKKKERKK